MFDRLPQPSFQGKLQALTLLTVLLGSNACSELSARSSAREGNEFYHDGEYQSAVHAYEESQRTFPDIPEVLLNMGLACRQLMVPGSDSAESKKATDCALDAFQRLEKLAPEDERPQRLYIQTLFDADRYEQLSTFYKKRLKEQPGDLAAINALIQVYSRWDKWEESLEWSERRAELSPDDAEAFYSVGVFIYNRLFNMGGAGDATRFDPRPDIEQKVLPPVFSDKDIVGEARVALADKGIKYLEDAARKRENYRDAITYLNLLYRQRSLAFLEEPEVWKENIDKAEAWRVKAQAMVVAAPPEEESGAETQEEAGEE